MPPVQTLLVSVAFGKVVAFSPLNNQQQRFVSPLKLDHFYEVWPFMTDLQQCVKELTKYIFYKCRVIQSYIQFRSKTRLVNLTYFNLKVFVA